MKKIFVLGLLCLTISANALAQGLNHWTAKVSAAKVWTEKGDKKYVGEPTIMGVKISLSKRFSMTSEDFYVEPQVDFGFLPYRLISAWMNPGGPIYATHYAWGISPSAVIGHQCKLKGSKALDFFLGGGYNFAFSQNSPRIRNTKFIFDGWFFRTGANFHLTNRWMMGVEYLDLRKTHIYRIVNSYKEKRYTKVKGLQLSVGYKF